MHCNEQGWDATGLKVQVEYDYLDNPARLGNFKLRISLPENLREHSDTLLEVAKTCPVHKTMEHHSDMEMTIE